MSDCRMILPEREVVQVSSASIRFEGQRDLREKEMRKYLSLVLALIIFAIIYEGIHALVAIAFDEYQTFVIHPYGLEVRFKTPVAQREGIKWGFISGMSNVVTLSLGYLLFSFRTKIKSVRNPLISALGYWLVVIFMLVDAFNLSIVPFIHGGDINGIAEGFAINRYAIQSIFFMLLLLNRELIVQKLLPVYGIKSKHPFFQSWIRLEQDE